MRNNNNIGILRDIFLRILFFSAIAIFFTMVNGVIDAVIIGKFLGKECFAALGLIMPLTLFLGLGATLLTQGASLLCAKFIGMADKYKTCEAFSTICIFAVLFSVPLSLLCMIFLPQIADLLSGYNKIYSPVIKDYLYGYLPSVPAMYLSLIFAGMMRLDNENKLILTAILTSVVVNSLADYAVVKFQGGMLGIALASSITNFVIFFIFLSHFFKKNILLHFSIRYWNVSHLIFTLKSGFSLIINIISCVFRTFLLNRYLLSGVVAGGLATLSIVQNISSLFTILATAIMIAVSTISSAMFGEEDRSGLEKLFCLSMRIGLKISLSIMFIIFIFAEPMASMYISEQEDILGMAVRGLRFFAFSMPFYVFVKSVSSYYLSLGKLKENYFVTAFSEGIFPVAFVVLSYPIIGIDGIWNCFTVGNAASIFFIPVFAWLNRNKRNPGFSNILLLKEDFGALPEDVYETTVNSIEQVVRASEDAQIFCAKKNAPSKTCIAIALCIEEMCKNLIIFGFGKAAKNHIEIRLTHKDGGFILKILDDCRSFDPVKWLAINNSEDKSSNMGIRLVIGMAKNIEYIPTMGINQLVINI